MNKLSSGEMSYYARHLSLPEIGIAGQEKVKASSILLIGLGGLGAPCGMYLAGAGVGRLGICEFDRVEISNLHRQVLYGTSLAGQPKLEAGIQRLSDLNPHIRIEPLSFPIDPGNARELIRRFDLVVDGTDNFPTRYLVNDACVLEGKPLVSASILSFEGQLSVFNYKGGPCYRCLYAEPPPEGMAPSCAEAGVLGVLPGVMGTLQAVEALKILLGLGEAASGKLISYDALTSSFRTLNFERDPKCALCGSNPTIRDVLPVYAGCAPSLPAEISEISAQELWAALEKKTSLVIVDVREAHERAQAKIEPSIHIPLADVLAGNAAIPYEGLVVLQCASGKRSLRAATFLKEKGHANVANLTGGISAWLEFISRR